MLSKAPVALGTTILYFICRKKNIALHSKDQACKYFATSAELLISFPSKAYIDTPASNSFTNESVDLAESTP